MTRVLVVDDEPGLRQSLGLLLTDAGFEVAAESDGRRALERATQEPFDIILCDVRMPQLDGLEFLRAYQKRDGGALVIMMSAYGGEEAALAAMKEGAYDYIPKPFRSDEVVLTLRKAEERERLGNTIATLRAQLGASPESRAVVAESAAMQARSRAPPRTRPGCSSRPMRGPCSWTRSASCPSASRPSCSGCSRTGRCGAWATSGSGAWTSGCSLRPPKT